MGDVRPDGLQVRVREGRGGFELVEGGRGCHGAAAGAADPAGHHVEVAGVRRQGKSGVQPEIGPAGRILEREPVGHVPEHQGTVFVARRVRLDPEDFDVRTGRRGRIEGVVEGQPDGRVHPGHRIRPPRFVGVDVGQALQGIQGLSGAEARQGIAGRRRGQDIGQGDGARGGVRGRVEDGRGHHRPRPQRQGKGRGHEEGPEPDPSAKHQHRSTSRRASDAPKGKSGAGSAPHKK